MKKARSLFYGKLYGESNAAIIFFNFNNFLYKSDADIFICSFLYFNVLYNPLYWTGRMSKPGYSNFAQTYELMRSAPSETSKLC